MSENLDESDLNEKAISQEGIQSSEIFIPISRLNLTRDSLENLRNQNEIKININKKKTNLTEPEQILLKQLLAVNYDLDVILFFIFFSQAKSENQIFDLLTTDEEDKYRHPFILHNYLNCRLCGSQFENHVEFTNFENVRAKNIYKEINKAIQNQNEFDINSFEISLDDFFTCQICLLEIPKLLIFKLNNDEHEICISCFKNYTISLINSGRVNELKCPHCSLKLSDFELKTLLDNQIYEKYQKFKFNLEIISDPLKRYCPNTLCSKIINLNKSDDKMAKCNDCNTIICTICNKQYHNNITCDEAMDAEIKQWSRSKEVQRCPKCKILTEKIAGCNHITCSLCNYQWCWICKGTYTSVHFLNVNPLGCPGLQFRQDKVGKWNFTLRLLCRFLSFLLLIVFIPFAILMTGPLWLFFNCIERTMFWRRIRNSCCKKCLFIIFYIIICIILEPIFILVIGIGFIPGTIFAIYKYIKERRRNAANIRNIKF